MKTLALGAALLLVTTGASAAPRTLSLDEALAALDRQNLSLAQARSRAEQAGATARQAQAALLPTLVASGSYTRNSDEAKMDLSRLPIPPAAGMPTTIVIQPLEQFAASGTLRVPLVVPTAWYDVSAAREGARAAEASTTAVRAQLRTGLAQAAYGATAIEEVVTASERAVGTASEHAKSSDRRVKAGTSPPLDSLRAQAELIRRESDLARARADLGRAQLALGVLLGRAEPIRVTVPQTPAPLLEGTATAEQVDDALARRPEMAAERAQIDAARAQLKSSWARFAPQLFATGSIFASDTPYPTGKKEGWRVMLELNWPLYDGGLRYGKKQQADAAIAEKNASLTAQRLTVIQQIEDAARDVSVARERLRLGEAQQKLAADAAASAQRSFDAGIASSLDTLDANDRLYQADVGLAEARAQLAQAVLALDQALGRGR
jgi:outer membrane protein TolC